MKAITTVFGLGHMRPASGTWASAAAIATGLVIDRFLGAPVLALATLLVTWAGFMACARSLSPGDDPSEVVIDEIAGQWLALLFPAVAFWANGHDGWLPWPAYVSAFLFFRLFDIWKPWLVGRADRRHDPAGVMLDDLWAGLFAGICVIITGIAYHVIFIF
ncbi:MAG: phosphatidylglycerophosphatase A family protein [Paracoccaceae bacterium]